MALVDQIEVITRGGQWFSDATAPVSGLLPELFWKLAADQSSKWKHYHAVKKMRW